jgi:hypothetical protein
MEHSPTFFMKRPFPRQYVLLAIGGCALVLAAWFSPFAVTAQAPEPTAATVTNEVVTNLVALPSAVAPTNMSPGVVEVARLAQANVSEEMLLTYIATADFPFAPTVDEILYLADLGISEKVITAIMNRAKEVRENPSAATPPPTPVETNVAAAVAPTSAPPEAVAPPAPAPTQEVTVVQAPAQPVTVNYFYETLSPYGSWIDVPDYGRCWRPTVVGLDPGWRPYADRGRWIYTDYGWYWQSDYSWGWAAFHYGRWHSSPSYGWVWVPGTTWGPAWVSWRSSRDYCGWAPLPPEAYYSHSAGFTYRSSGVSFNFEFGIRRDCYTFVPVRRFCDRDVYRHYVPPQEIPGVIGSTVVHNRYGRRGDVLVNGGIETDRLVAVTHKPIQPVAIRDLPKQGLGRGEILDRSSDTLYVHRPGMSGGRGHAGGPVAGGPVPGGAREFKPAGGASGGTGSVPSGSPTREPFAPGGGGKPANVTGGNGGSGFAGSPQPGRASVQPTQPQQNLKQPQLSAPGNSKHQGSSPATPQVPKQGFGSPVVRGSSGAVESKHPKVNVGQPVNHGSQFSPRFVSPSPAIAPTPAAKPVTPLSPREFQKPAAAAPKNNASPTIAQPTVPVAKPGFAHQNQNRFEQPAYKQPAIAQPTPSRQVISSPAQIPSASPKSAWTPPAQAQPTYRAMPATPSVSQPQVSQPPRGNAYGNSQQRWEQKVNTPPPRIESRPAPQSYSAPQQRQYSAPAPAPTPAPGFRASPSYSAPAQVPSQQRAVPSGGPAMAGGKHFKHSQGGSGHAPGQGGAHGKNKP